MKAFSVSIPCIVLLALPFFHNKTALALPQTGPAAQQEAAESKNIPVDSTRNALILPGTITPQLTQHRVDGSTYPSVDAAVAAAIERYPIAFVGLPCGTFTLDPLALPANSTVFVQGSGKTCTIVNLTGTANPYAIEMASGSALTLSALTLNLQGNAAYGITSSSGASAYALSLNDAHIENYTMAGIAIVDPAYVYITNHSWIGNRSALCTSWQCYSVSIATLNYSPKLIDVEDSTFDQSKEVTNNLAAFFVNPNPSYWQNPSPVEQIIVAGNRFFAPLRDTGESDALVLGSSDVGSSAVQFVTGVVIGNQMLGVGAYDSSFNSGFTIGSQLAGFESLAYTNNYVNNAGDGVLVENCPTNSNIGIYNLVVDDSGLTAAANDSYGLLISTATSVSTGTNPCNNVEVTGGRFSWAANVWATGIRIDGWSSAHVQGAALTNWTGAGIEADGGNTVIEDNLITFSPYATLAGPYPNGIVNYCGGSPCPLSNTSNYTFRCNTFVGVWKGIAFIGNMPLSNVSEDSNVMIDVANPYPQPYPGVSVTTQ